MSITFKPIYQPYNDVAQTIVGDLAAELSLTLKGKTGDKHEAVLASFLASVQIAGVGGDLNWAGGSTSQDTNGFALYPAAGATTIKAVRQALLDAGYLTLFDELPSGLKQMSNAEAQEVLGIQQRGRKRDIGQYRINATRLLRDARLQSAAFIDAQRPYVLVNKHEDPDIRRKRKQDSETTPRLPHKEVYKSELGRDVSVAQRTVKEMNAFWAKHPLTQPATKTQPAKHYASATRIFHNGDMKSGGRWYGGCTSIPNKEKQRLDLLIDDEAVCEIDLNASQPSLFSALVGIKMNTGDTWLDAYAAVVERLTIEGDAKLLRDKVKQVIVEMIGTGNANRLGPAKSEYNLFDDTEEGLAEYNLICRASLAVIPALHRLDGDYMNALGFLSYHEANILTETLLSLKKQGVAAYGVHDCIIVKQSDMDTAVRGYRSTIRDYTLRVQKQLNAPRIVTEAAVKMERKDLDDVRLKGRYT